MKRGVKRTISMALSSLLALMLLQTGVLAASWQSLWSAEFVQSALDYGWVEAGEDADIPADDAVSRADFAMVVWRMLGCPDAQGQCPFIDVTDSQLKTAVTALYEQKIIQGTSTTSFAPADTLSRQEGFVMLARALSLSAENPNAAVNFGDWVQVENWAQDAVACLVEMGVVAGVGDNRLAPVQSITLGELCKVAVSAAGSASGQNALYRMAQALASTEPEAAISLYQNLIAMGNTNAILNLGLLYRDQGDYKNALVYYEKAVEAGNMKAARYAGMLYEKGIGVEQNYEKAVEYFQIAADRGDTTGRTFLANMYRNGTGVEQDYEKAYEIYLDVVENPVGHAAMSYEACYWLGYMYENGIYVTADQNTAIRYYEQCVDYGFEDAGYDISYKDGLAAIERLYKQMIDEGNTNAILNLGLLYRDQGDYKNALVYYEKAVEAGNMKAARYAGMLYEKGIGVEQNYEKAVEYFQIAADRGDTTGRTFLANMYRNGTGVEQDYEKAYEIYLDVVENPVGHAAMSYEACYWLGYMYENGIYVTADRDTAIRYYEQCVDYGFEDAGYDISYKDGLAAIERLYKQMIDEGNTNAILNLGLLYRDQGDYENALVYYEKAVEAGNMKAARYAGMLYEKGIGVEQNYEKAVEYFQIAADRGDTTGRTFLANMYRNGTGVEQDYEKAYEIYLDVVENPVGHAAMSYEACYWLGYMYENGIYVTANRDTAIQYYQKCADFGFEDAGYDISYKDGQAALERLGTS